MADTIYIEKNGGHFEYFICNMPDDDEKSVHVKNSVVARESFKNADIIENVFFDKCNLIEESAFESCKELKNVIWKSENCNENKSVIKGITIPSFVSGVSNLRLQHKAFKNCSKLHSVILPSLNGRLTIEKEAFAGCTELRTVVFCGSCSIDMEEDSFLGCSKLTFVCHTGSPCEKFAREHGFRIVNF